MNNLPDFGARGYQVERELGQNHTGGRVTYLATSINTETPVVIKQFQFAQSGSSWSDYDAYEKEAKVLKKLNHPNIPCYLDSFETSTGFCLVQDYKKGLSLAESRYFNPEEIKKIAIAILEVLVYLQQQNPPIIHRDIKPENIIVNRSGQQINVYLVDFGFARMGGRDVAASSVIKGTLGFMPPEQLFNRQLTEASDLYSLGVTLIALLTRTRSTEIGNLIDESSYLKFKAHLPRLNQRFVEWLEKMVSPQLKHRFPNAAVALAALKSIQVTEFKNQSLVTERATLAVGAILVLGLAATQIPRFFESRTSQLVVTPVPQLESEPSPSPKESFSNSEAVPFYVSSLNSSYPFPDFPMKGTFEGEYRIHPDSVEIIVRKGTVYNRSKTATYLRSLQFLLTYHSTPRQWEKFPSSKVDVLEKGHLKPGDSYTFTNIRFVIPKSSATELSTMQMSFGIESGIESYGFSYVTYRPNWQ